MIGSALLSKSLLYQIAQDLAVYALSCQLCLSRLHHQSKLFDGIRLGLRNSGADRFFDAVYVMSYTATTIGYGEIPQPFTGAQRLWVMATIYLSVVGWAYAIGSLLTLLRLYGCGDVRMALTVTAPSFFSALYCLT